MSARIFKIGSIFTRTSGLIRKGSIDLQDTPLWFDIYYRFPPEYEPIYNRPSPDIQIPEILYKEDTIRAKIHKEFSEKLGIVNLCDESQTHSQEYIKLYQELVESKGMSENDAFEEIKKIKLGSSI